MNIPGTPTPIVDGEPLLNSRDVKQEKGVSLGEKDLGSLLSFIFIINQIYGPGVLAIPIVFQQSGWLLTMITVFLFMIISCLSSTCLCQAIAAIPNNSRFQQRIEYATVVKYYYGAKAHIVFQIGLAITLQAYNIASIGKIK